MALSLKLRRVKRQRRISVSWIPNLFTFANALFGFLAVISALEGSVRKAALCIFIAAIMDVCDGRLARWFQVTSPRGMELDSLCDAVSFCFAPMIVLYSSCTQHPSAWFIGTLVLYLCAGLWRLARFNCVTTTDDYFQGLPTTMAAFFIACIAFNYEQLAQSSFHHLVSTPVLMFIVLVLAALMISSIRIPSFKN